MTCPHCSTAHSPSVSCARTTVLDVELRELRRDAERYRWLRAGDNDELVLRVFDPDDKKPSRPFDLSIDYCYLPRDDQLDAAIDAALTKEPR